MKKKKNIKGLLEGDKRSNVTKGVLYMTVRIETRRHVSYRKFYTMKILNRNSDQNS